MSSTVETTYFDKGGPDNTEETMELAKARADARGITNVVVASYTGFAGAAAARVFTQGNLVVVAGMVSPDRQARRAMSAENRACIEAANGKILFCGHAFGMMGRAVHKKFGTIQIDEIVANVLRLFCQGVKVACECACMAADAGLIDVGAPTISIGGTGKGADTAIVMKPSNTQSFFDTRIHEIICKPRG